MKMVITPNEKTVYVRGFYSIGGGLDAVLVVGEEVDVLCDSVDNTVRDQGIATAEGKAMLRRRA
jgi:hypothetical protein